jgi:hypothetical protein
MLPEGAARLEDLTVGTQVSGVVPGTAVTILSVWWSGNPSIEAVFEDVSGGLDRMLVYHDNEQQLEVVTAGRPWSFEGDGRLFSLWRWRIKRADLNGWIDAQPRGGDGDCDGD